MKKFGIASVSLFVVSVLIYGILFFSEMDINGRFAIVVAITLPILGLISAFKSRGTLKFVGITGNSFLLFVSVVIPLVARLFWNQP
ncbi:hypothetical protein WAK64_08360 [Bacillus spongiae]|uniref:DUF3953 domain-containing protein n=1 Tax=Bacillus spongiae TaxID=2683610 RepID=A0ABU8HCI9_9BACI